MELIKLLRIIQRWRWPMLSVVLATLAGIFLQLRTADPVYEAHVKLQLTAPQQDDVPLFGRSSSSSLRDDVTIARNNFIELLRSREVSHRTSMALGLSETEYSVGVRTVRDSDFIYITIAGWNPQVAEQVANAHVQAAIEYYGEVRAKPATLAKNFLADQLRGAEKEMRSAENALAKFQEENNISSLDVELASHQQIIEQLQLDHDRAVANGPTTTDIRRIQTLLDQLRLERERALAQNIPTAVQRYDESIAGYSRQLETMEQNAAALVDFNTVISNRRNELRRLVALAPTANTLADNLKQTQTQYKLLRDKYTEAILKENTAKTANSIQIIEPALAPLSPAPIEVKMLLIVGLAGSLGLAVLIGFILEAISRPREPRGPITVGSSAR